MNPIDAAITALPLAEGRDPETALKQARMILIAGQMIGPVADKPRAKDATRSATRRELRELGDLCVKLGQAIDALHGPALRVLERLPCRRPPLVIADDLRSLVAAIAQALPSIPNTEEKGKGGRHPKEGALAIARSAAIAYEAYSGRAAGYSTNPNTREISGPFPRFVAAVFAALDVDADPVRYAVEAVKAARR